MTNNVSKLLSRIHPLFFFAFVILLGMYMFWRLSADTRKDKSSVFDTFFLSTMFGLIVGRISYIVTHWIDFSSYIWYWLPYEKYGEEIFLFRVLPWRFFRVWDWGIDILLMFVGFILFATIAIVAIKKWRWSHMFLPIFFTIESMLATSFFILGSYVGNFQWFLQGAVMLALLIIFFVLRASIRKVMIGRKEGKVLLVLDIFFVLLISSYIAYVYLSIEISNMEKGGLIFFITWVLWGSLMYIVDFKKANVTIEKVSSVMPVSSIDINQPIKLPKSNI